MLGANGGFEFFIYRWVCTYWPGKYLTAVSSRDKGMLVFLFTGGFVLIYLENIWQQYLQGIKVGWYFYVQVGLYFLYLLYSTWKARTHISSITWSFPVRKKLRMVLNERGCLRKVKECLRLSAGQALFFTRHRVIIIREPVVLPNNRQDCLSSDSHL